MKRLLLISAIAIIGGGVWWLSQDGSSSDGMALAEVKVPALTGTASQGAQIFAENCAQCHGENAAGRDGAGPPLVHIIYEPNHHGDLSFHLAVRQGVRAHHWPFGNMMPVEGVGEKEVEKIIAYVRTLQRANGIN